MLATAHVRCSDLGVASLVSAGLGAAAGMAGCLTAWGVMNRNYVAVSSGVWCIGTAAFHLGEYACVAFYRPREHKNEAFLLPGLGASREFVLAVGVAAVEWAVSLLITPLREAKQRHWQVSLGGGVAMLLFALVRIWGMASCGQNFSHIIETEKRPAHKLVKTGIYSVVRHPSYCGWFFWSLSSQVALMNPVSLVLYAAASYMFFKSRIPYEEAILASSEYFGQEYIEYRKHTWCGVPFMPSRLPSWAEVQDSDSDE
eukprot:Rhum_TRINITY_DN9150_c0_g1::Rhum_TRINITY_DN9150_c0_g1_i1::g.31836::m.31836/K00587/ICMT, STE14; protein-S-isoprenylcysteine O-methyltransferase